MPNCWNEGWGRGGWGWGRGGWGWVNKMHQGWVGELSRFYKVVGEGIFSSFSHNN